MTKAADKKKGKKPKKLSVKKETLMDLEVGSGKAGAVRGGGGYTHPASECYRTSCCP